MRQLDLDLAVPAPGALSEDVEDELRAVDDTETGGRRHLPALGGREILIDYQEIGAELGGADGQLVELSLADERLGIEARPRLREGVEHIDARRDRQLPQLLELRLGLVGRPVRAHLGQNGLLAPARGRTRPVHPGELLLEVANEIEKVEIELRGMDRVEKAVGAFAIGVPEGTAVAVLLGRPGQEVGGVGGHRQALFVEPDGNHEIEAEQREVGEIVPRERLALQVRVDEAEAPESRLAGPQAPEFREEDRPRIANHHVLDLPFPVHEDADLATGLVGQLGQVAGQLGGRDLVRRNPAAVNVLNPLDLIGLETLDVAV